MKNLTIKISILSTILLFGFSLELSDGKKINGDNLLIKDDVISIDTLSFNKNQVKQLIISEETTDNILPADISKNIIADSILFQLADEGEKNYPDADGIILIDWGELKLKSDGTQIYRYHFAGLILSEDKLGWGSENLYYEEGRSKNNVIFGRTISTDGNSYYLKSEDIKAYSPPQSSESFDFGKYLTFNLPNTTPGVIVEYEFENINYAPEIPELFFADFSFQSSSPTMWSKYEVIIPDTMTLNYKTYNMSDDKAKPNITENNGFIEYGWEMENIPPIIDEPKMPSYGDIIPRIKGTTLKDWNLIYDKFSEFQNRRMEITHEIKELAKKLTMNAKSDSEKVDKIYRYVQREIKYVSIKGSLSSGETGHSCSWTLSNKLGDCTDKSILFSTLLRVVGYDASPIILMTNDQETVDRTTPNTDGNHSIIKLKLNGKTYFLDATSTTHIFPFFRSDDYGATYYCCLDREVGTIPIPPANYNSNIEIIIGKIDKNGKIRYSYESMPYGNMEADMRYWWETTNPDDYKRIFEEWSSNIIQSSNLLKYTLGKPSDFDKTFGEKFSAYANDFPIFEGDMVIIQFPYLEHNYDFIEISPEKREYPIKYGYPIKTRHILKIQFPDEWEFVESPHPIDIKTKWGSYKGVYTITSNEIIFEDQYQRDSLFIDVKDYDEYKSYLKSIRDFVRKVIFFKRKV